MKLFEIESNERQVQKYKKWCKELIKQNRELKDLRNCRNCIYGVYETCLSHNTLCTLAGGNLPGYNDECIDRNREKWEKKNSY